ncbi:NADP-dependent oxidoreductase domain-containing protein [Mycena albidolilacea]|uniref:NADP-dependent oxidoreductase domain-containing protein n=1 Tax=Mycena albidolilacea TaxID=1033008 RepID=A0AAD6ZZ39_9AGAR|nr:NADP-dependent oxidoreductase domain-containing protein [Mycena albidolilacea]
MSSTTPTYTRLGEAGIRVSVPIVGCMSFGSSQQRPWILDEEPSMEVLKAAWDRGLTTFDTANIYSNGESERIIGKFLKKYEIPREKVIIATKVHHVVVVGDMTKFGFLDPSLRTHRDYVNQNGLSRAAIFNSVDASLKRLDTPYIDLLQIHRFDPNTPVAETMRALHDLVLSGKVRYIGASSMRTWRFAEMNHVADKNGWTQFVSMQGEYNLLQREEEREMIPYCKAHGIGLIPYSVLAAGNLTRPVDEQSLRSQTNKGTAFEYKLTDADKAIIGRVQEVAEKKGCTMSQVALAWVQLKVDSPIIGLASVKNVERSAEKGVELTPEEAKYLEELYVPKADRGYV